jgi:hypothetical protein
VPLMYDVCRELGLTYTFGIGMNSRLRAMSDGLLTRIIQTGSNKEASGCV